MKTPKIANAKARSYVQNLKPFQGENLFGMEFGPTKYVVYSYGSHWPLFANIGGEWFENSERYSVTTSKHRSQAHPHVTCKALPCVELKRLIEG